MAETKSCFIIMPITTPETSRGQYRDGDQHFDHVLQCLFIPAIEKADYKPVPPKAKGSDLIHAEIINQLEASDLVLCDMSCLNPNVFFELGIRTSLNKPVCVVKDEHTKRVPFDTGILNYLEYQSSLDPWCIQAEIDKLADHLRVSAERSKSENTLWRYFGLKKEARPYQGETGVDAKLDYISMQMESLKQKVDQVDAGKYYAGTEMHPSDVSLNTVYEFLHKNIPAAGMLQSIASIGPRNFIVQYSGELSQSYQADLEAMMAEMFGAKVRFQRTGDADDATRAGPKHLLRNRNASHHSP